MSTHYHFEATQGLPQLSLESFAVTRRKWLPIIEQSETFLAESEEEALEIAYGLKEELLILIGDEVGVGGSQERYDALVMEGMDTVSITSVTIQRAPFTQ